MTLLAGEIIDAARDRHQAFDRNRCPSKLARRFLSQYTRKLQGKVVEKNEAALLVEHRITLAVSQISTGIPLPANRYLASVVAEDTHSPPGTFEVDIIPYGQRYARHVPMVSCWQFYDQLYLNRNANTWRDVGALVIAYVPTMPIIIDDLTAIPLPDEAELALIENVALFFARRGHNDPALPAIQMTEFVAAAMDAEQAYLDDVLNNVTGQHFRTQDVWSDSGRPR